MTSADDPTITVYGAPWCPHCKRVRKFLAAHRVPYDHVDIDEQPEAIERLKELQGGKQIIPLVDFGDGTHEVNPSDEALAPSLQHSPCRSVLGAQYGAAAAWSPPRPTSASPSIWPLSRSFVETDG